MRQQLKEQGGDSKGIKKESQQACSQNGQQWNTISRKRQKNLELRQVME